MTYMQFLFCSSKYLTISSPFWVISLLLFHKSVCNAYLHILTSFIFIQTYILVTLTIHEQKSRILKQFIFFVIVSYHFFTIWFYLLLDVCIHPLSSLFLCCDFLWMFIASWVFVIIQCFCLLITFYDADYNVLKYVKLHNTRITHGDDVIWWCFQDNA